eukprot:CAMPEP_0194035548 /NCGR_PEP_ID=MMETSP0009_2-20130614/7957_1 /TAXON_ID=210454 /ORGANISM="Grammatophora oceanica, Strain CCMP 410" /LENGTH=222 /DNA_ID=CAMNT_0038676939 /DNA_START=150 /DNA_END=818 /DNA_ORIENTATION=+
MVLKAVGNSSAFLYSYSGQLCARPESRARTSVYQSVTFNSLKKDVSQLETSVVLRGTCVEDLHDQSRTSSDESQQSHRSCSAMSYFPDLASTQGWRVPKAHFISCPTPSQAPDFISNQGSKYWLSGDQVIRSSDHWSGQHGVGRIRNSVWTIDRKQESRSEFLSGTCHYKDVPMGLNKDASTKKGIKEKKWKRRKQRKLYFKMRDQAMRAAAAKKDSDPLSP